MRCPPKRSPSTFCMLGMTTVVSSAFGKDIGWESGGMLIVSLNGSGEQGAVCDNLAWSARFRLPSASVQLYSRLMRSHTTLLAWRESRELSHGVVRLAQSSWRPPLRAIFDQLLRSSLSIQLNIAEGYALGNTASFRRHLAIAYGSAIETGELLNMLHDLGATPEAALEPMRAHCSSAQRLILGLIRHMKQPP
ncbi:MAG: four helix bundle protein [Gemmatimonadales bacterium]